MKAVAVDRTVNKASPHFILTLALVVTYESGVGRHNCDQYADVKICVQSTMFLHINFSPHHSDKSNFFPKKIGNLNLDFIPRVTVPKKKRKKKYNPYLYRHNYLKAQDSRSILLNCRLFLLLLVEILIEFQLITYSFLIYQRILQ